MESYTYRLVPSPSLPSSRAASFWRRWLTQDSQRVMVLRAGNWKAQPQMTQLSKPLIESFLEHCGIGGGKNVRTKDGEWLEGNGVFRTQQVSFTYKLNRIVTYKTWVSSSHTNIPNMESRDRHQGPPAPFQRNHCYYELLRKGVSFL